MKPVFRWAGSKRQMLHVLRPFWVGTSARYIEPFAGSASLFFDLEPANAVLGDINEELIRAMRGVQHDVNLVLECYRRLRKSKRNYYSIRRQDYRLLSDAQCSARFIYLNRYCFNGLYRTNAAGRFNVPYGPPKAGSRLNQAVIVEASRALQKALLLNNDFQRTVAIAQRGDFVYLDPPYVTSARRVFCEYLPGSFGQGDLGRLAVTLSELHERGVTFAITYADTPEARQLLKPWRAFRVRTRRNIAGFIGSRRHTYELLATNREVGCHS